MSDIAKRLSPMEIDALEQLNRLSSILTSQIPEKSGSDHWHDSFPGIRIFRKLEKMGLCYTTEEDAMFPDAPEMGTWTPMVEITEEGRRVYQEVQALKASPVRSRKP